MGKKLELLAPAGNFTTLKAVINAGADAVYFGGSSFGARAYAGNFTEEEMLRAVDFCHIHGKKTYLTVNTLLKEREMEEQLYDYLLPFYEQGGDALIVQDFGVLHFVKEHFSKLPVHASTQMTVTGARGAKLLQDQGVCRVVTARELSLSEIGEIHRETDVEIETFVHGALCYCYSGQCLFSSIIGGRSGNRGRCAQPCRLPYECYDEKYHKITQKPEFPLSPKDLCTIDRVPDLAEHGVFSFKIEGRMKQAEYAAGVTSIYRKYMDLYLNFGKEAYNILPEDNKILLDLGNRSGFTEGYLNQWNGPDMLATTKPSHTKSNDMLQKEIRGNYVEREKKEKIRGYFVMKKGEPLSFTVKTAEITVKKKGEVPAEAKKQPLTEEKIREKLEKTGETPFEFESIDIDFEEGLFVPVSGLNELRRQALEILERELSHRFRRQGTRVFEPMEQICEHNSQSKDIIELSVSIENIKLFEILLKKREVGRIYIDSTALKRDNLTEELKGLYHRAKENDKELYLILPTIFRRDTGDFYSKLITKIETDGFLVRNYDALQFLRESGITGDKIRLDANMYACSNRTKQSFLKLGVKDTVPLELNRKELKARENCDSEMIVYGYLPMMTSAQCIAKTVIGCEKKQLLFYLKDRRGVYFPVKNHCGECYNTIYNSKPLQLYSVAGELVKMGITKFRLNFTVEKPEEAEQMLKLWCKGIHSDFPADDILKEMDFTYGHYKRGVE
ncbi:MAG: U32 family peptidase [Roseburia sp.]|nr:U32 family peptidase [Roseburia sp.]